MTGIGPLFLLWLFSQGHATSSAPSPSHGRGRRRRPPSHTDPHAYVPGSPSSPSTPGQPAAYHPGGGAQPWVVYKPLTAEVINRAEEILHTTTAPYETIEHDPTHPGRQVRYLRTVGNPPGKTSVTAWMPNPAAAAAHTVNT